MPDPISPAEAETEFDQYVDGLRKRLAEAERIQDQEEVTRLREELTVAITLQELSE